MVLKLKIEDKCKLSIMPLDNKNVCIISLHYFKKLRCGKVTVIRKSIKQIGSFHLKLKLPTILVLKNNDVNMCVLIDNFWLTDLTICSAILRKIKMTVDGRYGTLCARVSLC